MEEVRQREEEDGWEQEKRGITCLSGADQPVPGQVSGRQAWRRGSWHLPHSPGSSWTCPSGRHINIKVSKLVSVLLHFSLHQTEDFKVICVQIYYSLLYNPLNYHP